VGQVFLLHALEIVTEAVNSVLYREALKDAYKQVEKGVSLSSYESTHDEFPPILHQMMSVGEETGKLDSVLMKLSNTFEQESEQAVKNMTAAIEPMIGGARCWRWRDGDCHYYAYLQL
jgi:type IV pilus assembly protein PilC